jgi:hypothetical protein
MGKQLSLVAAIGFTLLFVIAPAPLAAVLADEAAALRTTLTPMGAERAGNADGTIPKWTGGYTTPFSDFTPGAARPDPFAAEKLLFSISAKNIDQYDAALSDGTKALLKMYPQSYRIDVYPTHRTAAAPQHVYENNLKNAVTARLGTSSAGPIPSGAFGGVPFPIPRTGAEAIWNHLLRWRGGSTHAEFGNYLGTADGKRVLVSGGTSRIQQPYYFDDPAAEKSEVEHTWFRVDSDAPPSRSGEAFVERDYMNSDKSNFWVYIPGQRRVRQIPNACCDTPILASGGVINFDEAEVWSGRIDGYEWNLVGKKEMYIPYNTNRSAQVALDGLFAPHHLNPDHIRWELHRVWVVDATLAFGKTNVAAKGRYYLDEDTWMAVLADRWGTNGQLIKTLWSLPLLMPEIPAVTDATSGGHDLVSGAWVAMAVVNGKSSTIRAAPRHPESWFTPDAMAGKGVR